MNTCLTLHDQYVPVMVSYNVLFGCHHFLTLMRFARGVDIIHIEAAHQTRTSNAYFSAKFMLANLDRDK